MLEFIVVTYKVGFKPVKMIPSKSPMYCGTDSIKPMSGRYTDCIADIHYNETDRSFVFNNGNNPDLILKKN